MESTEAFTITRNDPDKKEIQYLTLYGGGNNFLIPFGAMALYRCTVTLPVSEIHSIIGPKALDPIEDYTDGGRIPGPVWRC
jgi:hypothetical protein